VVGRSGRLGTDEAASLQTSLSAAMHTRCMRLDLVPETRSRAEDIAVEDARAGERVGSWRDLMLIRFHPVSSDVDRLV
jgi:hypothetical protein